MNNELLPAFRPHTCTYVLLLCKQSPHCNYLIEGVHDLHSLEILQNNLIRANRQKENSNSLAQLTAHAHAHNNNNRSLQEDDEGSGDSGESELELMMSEDFLEPSSNGAPKPRKPLRRKVLQGPHQKRRQSAPVTVSSARSEASTGGISIDRDCNRPSSPDLELRDPAFFDSLLSDNGSPRSEPCFSFIFDPPYSPPPPSFWSLPNSAFSRGGKRQGSTDSYTTSSTPHSDSPSECVYTYAECGSTTLSNRDTRSSSLSLSSSTTRHSSEDEEVLLVSSAAIDPGLHRSSHGQSAHSHVSGLNPSSHRTSHAPSMGARSATTIGFSGHRASLIGAGTAALGNSIGLAPTMTAQIPHFAKCTPRITKV
ncbi:uncharacterized protein LOC111250947 isoform X3 [Varroa destructor]|uniref:Uncharacterized protein n=1 Tax=Varroa destructor TaxID=109461 RepID=A0A7M7K7B4_VARDE|nr:uncharacterized protein LOC111250947 isoform X3 [Varroa destructor]